MELLTWVALGLMSGWILSILTGTKTAQGWLTDSTLGIIGAIAGGLMLTLLGQTTSTGITLYGVAIAGLGAIILIWLGRIINNPTV